MGRPGELVVVEAAAGRREELGASLAGDDAGVRVVDRVEAADGVVLAVKPPDVPAACAEVAVAGAGRVLSVAAGVTLASLERWLSADRGTGGDVGIPVVRGMPNTAALIGAGAAALAAGSAAGADDVAWATGILGAVGTVVTVAEPLLDAVTGLSGSGPAYVFLLAEALVDAGVQVGLPRPVAAQLANQTVLGAGRLLTESGQSPEQLRAAVTSPGGTTAAGLRALEAAGLRQAVIDAVSAAAARSSELGAP